jgi:LmbE family N-acetylglucosaminyl deacetylase
MSRRIVDSEAMKKNKLARRGFIKASTFGLGGISLASMILPGELAATSNASLVQDHKKLRVVCVGAHPGDPEFGCGGTMAKFALAGHLVTFLYLTRGEASDPSKSFAEMAALRTKEAENSCRILQAKPLFAGQIDGNTILDKEKNDEMTKLLAAEEPDLVFTHWPLDSHPDHQVAGMLTLTAWIRLTRKFPLFFYEVNTGSETMGFTPTNYVDITDVREKKMTALLAHKTQAPEETYSSYFRKMEEFRGLESGVNAAEGFILFTDKANRSTIMGL